MVLETKPTMITYPELLIIRVNCLDQENFGTSMTQTRSKTKVLIPTTFRTPNMEPDIHYDLVSLLGQQDHNEERSIDESMNSGHYIV